MKRIFVSHPYASNPEANIKSVDKICKYIARQGILPISPLHMFSFYEDDNAREEIIEVCKRLIDISDEVWIYGDSQGCRMEKEYAESINKPVEVFYD